MNKTTILITGANGQLGQALQVCKELEGQINWLATDYSELDITSRSAVDQFVSEHQPDYIINCAAYTAVDQAEKEFDRALAINSDGPANLAAAANSAGIPLIHISTDYVFNGRAVKPYTETDIPAPESAYGRSKLAGEQALLAAGGKMIIIRTSWLYSEYGKNFLLTMLRLGKEKESIGVVYDQVGSPTYAGDLATGILKVVSHDLAHPGWIEHPEIFHFSNTGVASWYDMALYIIESSGSLCKVKPILTAEYPLPAPRPAYSILDTRKFRDFFWKEIPYWRSSVTWCLLNYRESQAPK